MKRLYFPLLVVICFGNILFSSCMEKNEPMPEKKSAFAGTWEGTFSGADSGTWAVTISDRGEVVGSIKSQYSAGVSIGVQGIINNTGALEAYSITVGDTLTFVGQAGDSTAVGTWDASLNSGGVWAAERK